MTMQTSTPATPTTPEMTWRFCAYEALPSGDGGKTSDHFRGVGRFAFDDPAAHEWAAGLTEEGGEPLLVLQFPEGKDYALVGQGWELYFPHSTTRRPRKGPFERIPDPCELARELGTHVRETRHSASRHNTLPRGLKPVEGGYACPSCPGTWKRSFSNFLVHQAPEVVKAEGALTHEDYYN